MTISLEIRKLTIDNYKNIKLKVKEITKIMQVSKSSLYNWCNLENLKPLKIRKHKLEPYMKFNIRDYVIRRPNFNYKVLLKWIKNKYNIQISKSTLYSIIKKFNLTKKKINFKPQYKSKKEIRKMTTILKNQINKIKKEDIISIDETSVDNHLRNNYGWSLKGTEINKTLKEQRLRYSVLCAITTKQIVNNKIIKGSINGEQFLEFIKELELMYRGTTKYIFLDNARIHHYKPLKEFINNQTTLKLIYNVPYCPQYNPIEFMFNEFKNKIKNVIITKSNIIKRIKLSLKINNNNLESYFNKCLDNIKKYL